MSCNRGKINMCSRTMYLHCCILLLTLLGVVSESSKCILRGTSEKLFQNVALDDHKTVSLYVNGGKPHTYIATWIFANSSYLLEFNKTIRSNIDMDIRGNIWIRNVNEDDEGAYYIQYNVNNGGKLTFTTSAVVNLIVFELSEERHLFECQGNHQATTGKDIVLTKASTTTTEITTLPGKSTFLPPVADMSSSETQRMITALIVITSVTFIFVIVIILWLFRKKRRTQRSNNNTSPYNPGNEGGTDQRLDLIEQRLNKLEEGNNRQSSVEPEECPLVSNKDGAANSFEAETNFQSPTTDTSLVTEKDANKLITPLLKHWLGKIMIKSFRAQKADKKHNSVQKDCSAVVVGDASMCKVCNSKKCTMIFVPCGHQAACIDCAKVAETCPTCSIEITAKVEPYNG